MSATAMLLCVILGEGIMTKKSYTLTIKPSDKVYEEAHLIKSILESLLVLENSILLCTEEN